MSQMYFSRTAPPPNGWLFFSWLIQMKQRFGKVSISRTASG